MPLTWAVLIFTVDIIIYALPWLLSSHHQEARYLTSNMCFSRPLIIIFQFKEGTYLIFVHFRIPVYKLPPLFS